MKLRQNIDVLKEYTQPQGREILDIGAGDGHVVRALNQFGAAKVIGLECTQRQIDKAINANTPLYVKGFGQNLPFPNHCFDIAIFFNSLHHVPVALQTQALNEAARVIKPSGFIYVWEPIATGPFFELLKPIDDETSVRAQAYAAITQNPNLKIILEETYAHTISLPNFNALKDRIISANPEREDKFNQLAPQIQAKFTELAQFISPNFTFTQPIRINILKPNLGYF